MKHLLWLVLSVLLFSCDDKPGENLTNATGMSGDVYLIMDSTQYRGPLGQLLDSVFRAEAQVINRSEPIFKMRWVDPRKLNYTLKLRRNLIYAVTLDQGRRSQSLLTPESINRIKTDTSFFFSALKNQYARGQETFFLVGATEAALMQKIRKNAPRLVSILDKSEQERLTAQIYKSGQLKGLTETLKKKWNIDFKIPYGYELVIDTDEFIWVRQFNKKDDRDIFIYRTPYTNQKQFERDSLITLRNRICQKYLFGDPEKSYSYLVTEMSVPSKQVQIYTSQLNGKFTAQMRGLWKTNSLSMGGPFISYTVADTKQGMLYYVEGFVYAPSREQREIMREVETILNTFTIGK